MGLVQLLLDIEHGGPARRDAASQLYAELERMMREMGLRLRIPEQDRTDVVNGVMLQLLERRKPFDVARTGDERRCEAYLRRAIVNRYYSNLKSDRRRARLLESEFAQGEPQPAAEPFVTGGFGLQDAWSLLEKVHDFVRSKREERFRPALDQSWRQLRYLVREGGNMDALLLEEGGTEPGDRKRAQQRIHTNQSRLRKDLAMATDALSRAGGLSAEEAGLVHRFIKELNQRQKTATTGISKGETT